MQCSDLFPGCEGVVPGQDEQEVLSGAAEHAKAVHGMTDTDMTPEFVQQVRDKIDNVS